MHTGLAVDKRLEQVEAGGHGAHVYLAASGVAEFDDLGARGGEELQALDRLVGVDVELARGGAIT